MSFPNWGNVPSWLAAGSLLLAFRIFTRDRVNAEREQVDLVGWWATISPNTKGQDDPEVIVVWHIRNASELPIDINYLEFRLDSRWLVPLDSQEIRIPDIDAALTISTMEVGRRATHNYFMLDAHIPPKETWESAETLINVASHKPSKTGQLDFRHTRCVVNICCITDNAGRRWRVSPGKGERAKRHRWYSRNKGVRVPPEWLGPIRGSRRWRQLNRLFRSKIPNSSPSVVEADMGIRPKGEI